MISRSTKIAFLTLFFLCLAAVTFLGGCKPKRTAEEQLTLDRVRTMIPWVEDFKYAFSRYPNNWGEVLTWKGETMPLNPYTNQPMVALESGDFDPKVSPGNFFFARVIRDDEVINYQVVVFGKGGEIRRISHSPMAAK